jgi:erythromycin esterase
MARFHLTRRVMLGGAGGVGLAAGAWWGYRVLERQTAEKEVLAWMKPRLERYDASRPESLTASGALLKALAGAKVIGLGEATHGSHEDLALKSEIIRALVRAGTIDTIFLEANSAGGRQLDAYVAGGEGAAIDYVKAADIFMILKTRALADLMEWLREWNRTSQSRIRIVGVDCQATAPDTAFAIDWLRTVDPVAADAFAGRLKVLLDEKARARRFPDLIGSLTTAALQQAMKELQALLVVLGSEGPHANREGRQFAEQSARTAWQGLKAFELETVDGTLEGDLSEYFSRRDAFMAENIERLAQAGAGVYWAHNVHVAGGLLNDSGLKFISAGYQLRQRMGEAYRAVLFEFGSARFNAVPFSLWSGMPKATDPKTVIDWPYRSGRLAGLFRHLETGDAWIDLSAIPGTTGLKAWSQRPYPMYSPGYAAMEWIDLENHVTIRSRPTIDILIYIEVLGPSRLL